MYSAIEIANFFIKLSKRDSKPIDNMKLQKLVYISYGYYLAYKDDFLIDESIQAWEYGPVINSLYRAFKQYGNSPITEYCMLGKTRFFSKPPMVNEDDKETVEFLEGIWESYGKFNAIELSHLTHIDNSPWDQTYKNYKGQLPKEATIDPEIIKSYYKNKLNKVE